MEIPTQEIEEAIEHQKKMLRVLRQRLQKREIQEAEYGINAPPEILSEIDTLTDRIRTHETELARLQSLAAEDKSPLAEVEFRALLAEALDTSDGKPTIVGIAKLELARLRIGLKPGRSQEIEREVRLLLAKETFYKIHRNMFNYKRTSKSFAFSPPNSLKLHKSYVPGIHDHSIEIEYETLRLPHDHDQLRYLGRAIRLDTLTTLKLFLDTIPLELPKFISIRHQLSHYRLIMSGPKVEEVVELGNIISGRTVSYLEFSKFKENLIEANNIWPDQSENSLFDQFVQELESNLAVRQQAATTFEQVLKEVEVALAAHWQSNAER